MKYAKIYLTLTFILLFIPVVSALSEQQIIQIATNEFNQYVPLGYRYEYVFSSIGPASERDGTHNVIWKRIVNGFPVYGDRVVIRVFDVSGEIDFKYIRREQNVTGLDSTIIITLDQSRFAVERNIGTISEDKDLEIQGNRLYYTFQIKGGNLVRVDAKTGFAETYAWSRGAGSGGTAQFNSTQYFVETQLAWIIGTLIVISIGGFVYYEKWHK